MKKKYTKPEIGQIWKDADPRLEHQRQLEITDFIDGGRRAVMKVLDGPTANNIVRIKTARLRPASNGYNLVKDVPAKPSQAQDDFASL